MGADGPVQLHGGVGQAQGVEGRSGVVVVAAVGQVVVAQHDVDVGHARVVHERVEEAVAGREHMRGLAGPRRQQVAADHDALHLVPGGDRRDPRRRVRDTVQVLVLEVDVGQEEPFYLAGTHGIGGIGGIGGTGGMFQVL